MIAPVRWWSMDRLQTFQDASGREHGDKHPGASRSDQGALGSVATVPRSGNRPLVFLVIPTRQLEIKGFFHNFKILGKEQD